ncbi:MAG TPA: hypothetical protein VKZ18_23205 [Polyangia bacterium]|nr:hypothetical protein [Polyangia bacterium]
MATRGVRKAAVTLGRISAIGLALLGTGALSSPARALEPAPPRQEAFLKRAVYAEGRLWLLSDSGQLSSLAEHDAHRAAEALPGAVADVCRRADAVVALTCAGAGCGTLTIRGRRGGSWIDEGSVALAPREELLSMTCGDDAVLLLTDRRLVERSKAGSRAVSLSGDLGPVMTASTYVDGPDLLVGINAGEWGGGLRRIDRRSGKVSLVARNAAGGICDGPLNAGCDPVNAVVADPWRPACVVAAIGLVHFMSHGRLVEVCGDRVTSLYYKPYGDQPPRDAEDDRKAAAGDLEPPSTVAFFGLVRAGGALWAAGIDGLYRFDKGTRPKLVPLPAFAVIDGIRVSFQVPGLALVITEINRRKSMGGGAPMLVAR